MKLINFVLLSLAVISSLPTLVHAQEQVVIIANRSTAVDKVEPAQATQIFLKQIQTWPDGKPIVPIDIKEGSPLRAEFYSKVTGRSTGQLRAYWARQAFTGMGFPPKQVASAEEVAKYVQNTPGAVGYVSKQQVDSQVKVLLDSAK
jgi:ABC-type phosphate transport system substrate-binding protein